MRACKVPCNECPFRKDSLRGWLGPHTAGELHDIVKNEIPFPCHMTHEGVEWEDVGTTEVPVCAGSLLYMKKACKLPRNPELHKLTKSIEPMTENILSSIEFFEHHNPFKDEKQSYRSI